MRRMIAPLLLVGLLGGAARHDALSRAEVGNNLTRRMRTAIADRVLEDAICASESGVRFRTGNGKNAAFAGPQIATFVDGQVVKLHIQPRDHPASSNNAGISVTVGSDSAAVERKKELPDCE